MPAGAIPKDGPSAGVTMVTALASLLTGRPVKSTVGMTGEVTLQGRVLPIGGLKQKVLAAHAAGLTEVILPERNAPDLDDVPADVREHMTLPPSAGRRGARRSGGDTETIDDGQRERKADRWKRFSSLRLRVSRSRCSAKTTSMSRRTTSMPTPRPERSLTSAAVEKPGSKTRRWISASTGARCRGRARWRAPRCGRIETRAVVRKRMTIEPSSCRR